MPADIHAPATSRLWWFPVHVLLIGVGITALTYGWLPLSLAWIASLLIGLSFAGLTFVAHETLHGAVVHGRGWQRLVGGASFLPFCISPRLWVAWHNRRHHGHTQRANVDPDSFPTESAYDQSKAVRFMIDRVGASRGAPGGALALLLGFTIQSTQMLLGARNLGLLTRRDRNLALLHTGLAWSAWLAMGWLLGWVPFVFGFVLPLTVANTIVMAHILTNHSLSPLTEINDPLLNSLSVTIPGWASWLTLGFGYHVEHHLFPWMSTRHAKTVKALILARWPERYQSMPLWQALWAVYTTPRVYADETTLVDKRTGRRWPTLTPRADARHAAVHQSSAPLGASRNPSEELAVHAWQKAELPLG